MPQDLIRHFDQEAVSSAKASFESKEGSCIKEGIQLYHQPYTHCILSDLVTDSNFINELRNECKTKLKYIEKNNDLYKFHQTKDLSSVKSKAIRRFRDEILYGEIRGLIENLTGIELSTKIDVTSSRYDYTDYLLCHDDDIHDDQMENGRRIAFIYYLVPSEWNDSDGGLLDLFNVNENLQPTNVAKSIKPEFNSLAFFEVSDRSFHQVAEVLSQTKSRLSINGWFHGKINKRPIAHLDPVPETLDIKEIEATLFFDWIVEKYLKPTNQTEIQLKFMDSSEIKLDKVFHEQKYKEICDAFSSDSIVWKRKGPYNKANYEVAEVDSLPQIVSELVHVLTSEFMGLSLSNMTGLALHWSIKKAKDEDNLSCDGNEDADFSEDFSGNEEDGQDESNSNVTDDQTDTDEEIAEVAELEMLKRKNNFNMMNDKKKVHKQEYDSSMPGTSASKESSFTADQASTSKSTVEATTSADTDTDEFGKPKFHCEVRRWKQGNYTLVTDDNKELKTKALDLMVFFNCGNWSPECGGNVSYIARNEDDELLTVCPEENCISLVYRDEDTLRFTKCLNSKYNEINNNNNDCFYEISVVYYE